MIVLEREGRLLLLSQLDHATLAGRFAAAWGNDGFQAPAPSESVVLAASRHDEGWREWDAEFRFDATRRAPLYFLDVDIRDYVSLYSRGIARIAELDPYAGLLASLHGTGNLCGRWGTQPGIRLRAYDEATWPPLIEAYVLEQEALQARLKLRILSLRANDRRSDFERRLWSNYELLQAWDRLSLFLCRSDPRRREAAELGAVPRSIDDSDRVPLVVQAEGGGLATVTPWPFAPDRLEASIPVRRIPDRPYLSPEDVHAEVRFAPHEELRWTLAKGDRS